MRVLAANPGHDGAVALVEDGQLRWSLEAEKDSFPRNGTDTLAHLFEILEELDDLPDAIVLGGWEKTLRGHVSPVEAGYHGLEPPRLRRTTVMGRKIVLASSSHERSHIFAGIGMSGTDADDLAVLTWEGAIGALYRVGRLGATVDRLPVMHGPGHRFGFLYCLADPSFVNDDVPLDVAGKLMALAAYGRAEDASPQVRAVVDQILQLECAFDLEKPDFRGSPLWSCGFESESLRNAARLLADLIFDRFLEAAFEHLPPGLPLIIGGGCGLNCDWNTRWVDCGHFSSVFVPPCPNDSGSAIGSAVDVQNELGGGVSLSWSVYSGPRFVVDSEPPVPWCSRPAEPHEVAALLACGQVLPFVHGRCEIGPRALGHRSILATALDPQMTARLNTLKGRESYRPIAPCCREDDFDRYFAGPRNPHMLFFDTVITDRTPATTHVDGSARVQVVGEENQPLAALLAAFGGLTGTGVLCNTSLNFPGVGFINRMSELVAFCEGRGLDAFVAEGFLWSRW
jgi:hydroxymethyl cephem carbamoyltransferase